MKASKGEEKIINILKKGKVKFEREKSFENLARGKYRFDFFIANYRGVPYAIEYNGEQHYKQIKKFQPTRRDFLAQKERDRRKISYCLAHKINLYIIPYWEIDKIEKIADLFREDFHAKSKWHCDVNNRPKFDKPWKFLYNESGAWKKTKQTFSSKQKILLYILIF